MSIENPIEDVREENIIAPKEKLEHHGHGHYKGERRRTQESEKPGELITKKEMSAPEAAEAVRRENLADQSERERLLGVLRESCTEDPKMGSFEMDTQGRPAEDLKKMANETTVWGRFKNWFGDNIYKNPKK